MYNGIGLTTPRGSGTNGHVQKNLSHFRAHLPRKEYDQHENEAKMTRLLAPKKSNTDILEHDRKRQVEVSCLQLQLELEEKGYVIAILSPLSNVTYLLAEDN
jgi:serine/arginine repetitive matrix protein 2